MARRSPPQLMEELIAQVLLCVATDEPADLFRLTAVTRGFHQLVSGDDALRRYREHHGVPPLLGFFQNPEYAGDRRPRFVPTTSRSPPLAIPILDFAPEPDSYWTTLDCRHGRVLVHSVNPLLLHVWDPITSHRDEVLLPTANDLPYNSFAGAVLCAADGCDHLDCAGGPFRVVFAATAREDVEEVITWACVYSSHTGAWTAPVVIQPGPMMGPPDDAMGPGLLLGDSIYFPLDLLERRAFAVYRLAQNTLSMMEGPPMVGRDMVLVAAEGNRVGVATMEGNILQVWSRPVSEGGDWSQSKFINLDSGLLRAVGNVGIRVAGYAEGADLVFVSGNFGMAILDLKSGEGRKVSNYSCLSPILPYIAFYTRGVRAGFGANMNG